MGARVAEERGGRGREGGRVAAVSPFIGDPWIAVVLSAAERAADIKRSRICGDEPSGK